MWSLLNRRKVERLIAEGRMTSAGLAAVREAKKRGLWEAAYTSRSKGEIPPDLKVALEEHPAAKAKFDRLANSYRNMYISWVNTAKTGATRKKRIEEVVRRVADNIKFWEKQP
jgi:uncharacterized protein YdeI (YjbR/CyaY-like superfamily)